jgi:hypothetical protein
MLMAIALMLKVTPDTLLGFDETRHHEHSVERYRSMLMVECARGFAAERAMASKGLAAEKREAFRSADAAMRKAVRNLESQIATLEKKYLPWLEEEVSAKRAPGRREDEA